MHVVLAIGHRDRSLFNKDDNASQLQINCIGLRL